MSTPFGIERIRVGGDARALELAPDLRGDRHERAREPPQREEPRAPERPLPRERGDVTDGSARVGGRDEGGPAQAGRHERDRRGREELVGVQDLDAAPQRREHAAGQRDVAEGPGRPADGEAGAVDRDARDPPPARVAPAPGA